MEMPKVDENHKKLEKAMAGKWVGEETIHPSPWDQKGGQAKGTMEVRTGLDGFWLIADYTQERDGKITYRGHSVFGWDPKTSKYSMYWFDTMGMDPRGAAYGRWEGDTLAFEMSHEMGHSRYIYRFTGENTYAFRIEHSQDQKSWKPFIDSRWTRR